MVYPNPKPMLPVDYVQGIRNAVQQVYLAFPWVLGREVKIAGTKIMAKAA